MLRAIYELGKLMGDMLVVDEVGEVDWVLVFDFDRELKYLGLRTEDFKKDKEWMYLHMRKGNIKNQAGFTPTEIKTVEKLRKDTEFRTVEGIFSTLGELYGVPPEKSTAIKDLQEYLADRSLKDSNRLLITVRIGGKYLGEIESIREKVQEAVRRWYEEKRRGGYGICSLCGQEKRVIGDYMPLTVYTVDNPAYAPHLDRELAHNHMPACADCIEVVKRGMRVMNLFKFTMAGFEYFFIPEPILSESGDKLIGLIDAFQKEERRRAELADGEVEPEEIKEVLGIEDDLRVHLLYLEKRQSAVRILHLIQEVFPSRLGYLYRLKRELEEKLMLERFSYYTLKRLCPDDSFFLLLRASFLGEKINNLGGILLSGLRGNTGLCYDFTAGYLFVKKAMEGRDMEEFKRLDEETPEEFFRKYFDGSEILTGLALLGYLVARVEKVQLKRGYTPNMYLLFQEFNLDWSGVDRLIRELTNKINRYELGGFYYQLLNSALERLGQAERKKVKREDINTALCVGYATGYKKKGKEVENDEEA